jgi:DNA-binding CsgD family transcriptional regulator
MTHLLESQALSPRQQEILVLLGEGVSPAAIAARLDLSLPTVRNHIAAALHKLDCHSALEAVAVARRHGLI